MKKLLGIIGIALTFAIALGAGDSFAGRDRYRNDNGNRTLKTFTLSGVYSGELDRAIKIGNKTVYIDRATNLHSTEHGRIERGYTVSRNSLYVGGVIDGKGRLRATMIIVKDSNRGGARRVGVVSPDEGS